MNNIHVFSTFNSLEPAAYCHFTGLEVDVHTYFVNLQNLFRNIWIHIFIFLTSGFTHLFCKQLYVHTHTHTHVRTHACTHAHTHTFLRMSETSYHFNIVPLQYRTILGDFVPHIHYIGRFIQVLSTC